MVERTLSRPALVAAVVALAFGALTVVSGGMDMGAVVPFVLWFNFLAGFAYITAGLALRFKARRILGFSLRPCIYSVVGGAGIEWYGFGLESYGFFWKMTGYSSPIKANVSQYGHRPLCANFPPPL